MDKRKSSYIFQKDSELIAPGQHLLYFPLVVDSVNGDTVIDVDGKSYIDFLSSASSLNLGGAHPTISEAIKKQVEKCTQYCTCYSLNQPMVEYAERLASIYPGKIPSKILFTLCGSSAIDMAFNFAKAYTKRNEIISFKNSFHGNTYASSNISDMDRGNFPILKNIHIFSYFYEDDPDIKDNNYLAEIEEAFKNGLNPKDVAAVFIEPIQGDGGLRPAKKEFIRQLYLLCKKHGILFISDEVQQGFFRSGSWFSIEHYNVIPDGIVLGKSLGAGLPLGAFMARSEIMESLNAELCASTIAGYQLACATGIAQFDYMCSKEFKNMLKNKIELLSSLQKNLVSKSKMKGRIKIVGEGFSYGIQIFDEEGNRDRLSAFKIAFRCYEKGLLLITVGGNTLRIQPPFSISIEHLNKGFQLLKDAICDVNSGYVTDEMLYFYKRRYPEIKDYIKENK